MDLYDRASEASLPPPFRALEVRRLTGDELELLINHLLDTEMPVPVALRALGLNLPHLTIDDLECLASRVARCRHCNTWTRLSQLVRGVCPDCEWENR